jgi:hypothetical protein
MNAISDDNLGGGGCLEDLGSQAVGVQELASGKQAPDHTAAAAALPEPEMPAVLSAQEERELAMCEAIIKEGLETFVGVGVALTTIRDRLLYRVSFDTFEDYVASKWAMSVRHAHRLCFAANFVKTITDQAVEVTPGSLFPLPHSEKQVRALNRLRTEPERIAAWREACSSTTRPNGVPSSKEVERIVGARLLSLSPATEGQVSASSPITEAIPAGNREQRAREALRRAITAARELVDTLGTADSVVTARAALTLEQLQGIGDHLARLERMQAARKNGERLVGS